MTDEDEASLEAKSTPQLKALSATIDQMLAARLARLDAERELIKGPKRTRGPNKKPRNNGAALAAELDEIPIDDGQSADKD